ncbi:MAG: glucosamine-6-phosphate deaminase [Planctomycetota bacterium]
MEIIITSNYNKLCEECIRIISDRLHQKPNLVMGLPAGKTPLGVYRKLVRAYHQGNLDFSRIRIFNLDEYVGLPTDSKHSFHYYLWNNLLRHINIKRSNIYLLDSTKPDLEKASQNYEKKIKAMDGIDLMMLGIGKNGHIGFNEPGSSLSSRTRVKTLIPTSAQSKPRFVLTMGIGTIMEAKEVIILARGNAKAGIVKKMVEGSITADVPASVLQWHPRVICILDRASARLLKKKKYWQWIRKHKIEMVEKD